MWLAAPATAEACTAALVAAKANPTGRPMIWKHRDTSSIDNVVDYIPSADGALAYVALFNAADRDRTQAWMGMNSAGFAVMNTASYNIKDDDLPESAMDREGLVMTIALRSCRTLDDFRTLLRTLPRPLGVEANFAAIDASGEGAWFETNNHTYIEFNLRDDADGVMVRTNYSHGGRAGEGLGRVREATACRLLAPYAERGEVTAELLTETVSRSFWHDVMKHDYATAPALSDADALQPSQRWAIDQDFIPRYKSTATVVIEGCVPGTAPADATREYVMWTGLGYPPCAEIYPVWCTPDGVHADLQGTLPDGLAPAALRAKQRRDDVFGYKLDTGDRYIDLTKLFNADGTGYVQTLVPQNLEVYKAIRNEE